MTVAPLLSDYGVLWLDGFEVSDAVGDCEHDDCRHVHQVGVAVGPSKRTTRLVECSDCRCRVWFTDKNRPAGKWQQVGGEGAAESTARWNRIAAIRRRARL